MAIRSGLLEALGGESGCHRLSHAFYARVAKDPVLRPLFPGKSLRCAIEEFAAFLVQFLGGAEDHTQHRWWLSLRESHARFRIGQAERGAWLRLMGETLDASPIEEGARSAFRQFFLYGSAYVTGENAAGRAAESTGQRGSAGAFVLDHAELHARWTAQLALDDAVSAIANGDDRGALALLPRFASRPSVFAGLLARILRSGRADLIRFAADSIEKAPELAQVRFSGKYLLHFAAGAGCQEAVAPLLRLVTDPDLLDRGGHTPLYCLANECGSAAGPDLVRMLVQAGADPNACGGVTRATPLHMAARRGYVEIARALLDCGAVPDPVDSKGVTPLRRAIRCRKDAVARLLAGRGGGLMAAKSESAIGRRR